MMLVVGGGLAGTMTALAAAESGDKEVRLLVTDENRFDSQSGTVDVLGSLDGNRIVNPFDAFDRLPENHPYRRLGRETVREALVCFDEHTGYLGGETDQNALVLTHAGRVRPTARYPPGMAAGLASRDEPMRLVGFEQTPDFDAHAIAATLDGLPYEVTASTVDFPGTVTAYPSAPVLASALDENNPPQGTVGLPALDSEDLPPALTGESTDSEPTREVLTERVWETLETESRVGFPAVLGESEHQSIRHELSDALAAQVFEIPIGPPSIPGRRLKRRLRTELAESGVQVERGDIRGFKTSGDEIAQVALPDGEFDVDRVVLATGDLTGPGLETDSGQIVEPRFGTHVEQVDSRSEWTRPDPLGAHPLVRAGVTVDDQWRPLDAGGRPAFENLHAVGRILGGIDYDREGSSDGVAIATGYAVGRQRR